MAVSVAELQHNFAKKYMIVCEVRMVGYSKTFQCMYRPLVSSFTFSEPAKSTRYSLPFSVLLSPPQDCRTCICNTL